jgi:hypothetical protein
MLILMEIKDLCALIYIQDRPVPVPGEEGAE